MPLKKGNAGIRVANKHLKHIALLANNFQGYSNFIHIEMRRAKLAPASLPPGALPSTSWYEVPRCFVCDEAIKSHRLSTSLLAGRTQYSHSPLPSKIGEYIGDEFVVVVTAQDALCKHCMALINTMDRLEQELCQHRNTLTQNLKTKYGLDVKSVKQAKKPKVEEEEDDPVVIELSDEEWTPNKKQRTEVMKQHRCTICNAIFSNLSHFMAHLSRHKQLEKPKPKPITTSFAPTTAMGQVSTTVSVTSSSTGAARLHLEQIAQSMFKCGCCTESFTSKEKLADHMRMHTANQSKTTTNQSQTVVEMKLVEDAQSMNALESSLQSQATALFEDLEQLPEPEIPPPAGVCTEEQKGKVCLLALLNNGVCSDLSHRAPVDNPPAASVVVSLNSDVHGFPNMNDPPTISVTVSVPSDISSQLGIGGNSSQCMPIMGQPQNPVSLSLPSSGQHYQSVNPSSIPLSQTTKAIVVTIPDKPSLGAVMPSSNKSCTSRHRMSINKTEVGKQFEICSQLRSSPHSFGGNNSLLDMSSLVGSSSSHKQPGPGLGLSGNVCASDNLVSSSVQHVSNKTDNIRLDLSSMHSEGNYRNSSIQNVPSMECMEVEGMPSGRNTAITEKSYSGSMQSIGSVTSTVMLNVENSCVQDMPDLDCIGKAQNMPDLGCNSNAQNLHNLKRNRLPDGSNFRNTKAQDMPSLQEITNLENSGLQGMPNVSSSSTQSILSLEDNTRAQDMPELRISDVKSHIVERCSSADLPDLFGTGDLERLNKHEKDPEADSSGKDGLIPEGNTLTVDSQDLDNGRCLQEQKSEIESLAETKTSVSGSVEDRLSSDLLSTTSGVNIPKEPKSIPASINSNTQNPLENIAIVSVTSVQVSGGDSLDAEHMASEWFYSNSDKPESAKASESDLIFEQSWLQETKDPSGSSAN